MGFIDRYRGGKHHSGDESASCRAAFGRGFAGQDGYSEKTGRRAYGGEALQTFPDRTAFRQGVERVA